MIELGIIASSTNALNNLDFNQNLKFARLTGVYIPDYNLDPLISDIPLFSSSTELISESDAILFIGEHHSFHCLIINALKNSKHVKIYASENYSSFQLADFLKLALEANVCISTGSEWLDNKNISSGIHYATSPSLIEFKQSLGYNTTSQPFDFFKKKIYNAVYFSLNTLRSNPKKIYALGVSTFTKTIDFINASIEFDNGSIIRLQIGAIDPEIYTKCRIHQKNAIAIFDLCNLKSSISFLNVFKDIDSHAFETESDNKEGIFSKTIHDFIETIRTNRLHHKSIEIACETALLTEQILEKLKIRSEINQLFAVD